MVYIILYHFCSYIKAELDSDNRWILLGYTIFHIGVPIFIMISGYFTIKFSVKKIISFYLYCTIWYFICYGIGSFIGEQNFSLKDFLTLLFPFSHTRGRWFVTYYFWLMILSPLLNQIKKISLQKHLFFVAIFIIAIFYMGLIWQSEVVNGGKSVVYFVGLYLLGTVLRRLDSNGFLNMPFVKAKTLWGGYILILIIVSIGNFILPFSYLRVYRGICFAYQGPILILQALLFMLIFLRIKLKKVWINHMATSSFAIYLFHENQDTSIYIYKMYVNEIYTRFEAGMFPMFLILCFSIFIVGILLDNILRKPLQRVLYPIFVKLADGCLEIFKKSLTNAIKF